MRIHFVENKVFALTQGSARNGRRKTLRRRLNNKNVAQVTSIKGLI